jgi:hypothetical protein
MMYMLRSIPENDNVFLQAVELARQRIEEMKRCATARNCSEVKPPKNTTETEKITNKNKDNRKETKKQESYKNNKKEKKEKKPKEKKYGSTKEALKWISEELIQKHKSTSASCWRSGRSNHCTTECFGQTNQNRVSLEKLIISSQNRTKRNNDYAGSKTGRKQNSSRLRGAR